MVVGGDVHISRVRSGSGSFLGGMTGLSIPFYTFVSAQGLSEYGQDGVEGMTKTREDTIHLSLVGNITSDSLSDSPVHSHRRREMKISPPDLFILTDFCPFFYPGKGCRGL